MSLGMLVEFYGQSIMNLSSVEKVSLLKMNFYLFFLVVRVDDNRKIYNLFQDTITEYAKKLYLREMSRLEYEAQTVDTNPSLNTTFDTKSSLNTVDYTSGMH